MPLPACPPAPPACGHSPPLLPPALPQEAFQLAQAHGAPGGDEEFPGLDWEGWEEIAAALGITDIVDAPVFRWVLAPRRPPAPPARFAICVSWSHSFLRQTDKRPAWMKANGSFRAIRHAGIRPARKHSPKAMPKPSDSPLHGSTSGGVRPAK